ADRNRSHWSTSKTPSYTKSVSWQHHLWSEDNHFRSATLSSTFSFAGLETLNIAGRDVLCNVWQEEVTSTLPEKQWQNTFWVDSATGQVRQSRQMLGAGVIPVEMTFLKPAP
uniref:YjbF family lipoprotein n=1 Tax=Escherichia coli TaxID=562 RepID=UPI0021A88403